MVDSQIRDQIILELGRLPSEKQRQVLEYARGLDTEEDIGVPGRDLLRFFGTIDAEDCETMRRVIEEACERIDPNEW